MTNTLEVNIAQRVDSVDLKAIRDQLQASLDETRAFPESGAVLYFPKARMCLGFRSENHSDLTQPFATNLLHARVFVDADRMGPDQLPELRRTFTNGAGEAAALYATSVVKKLLIADLESAIKVIEGTIVAQESAQ